MVQTVNPKLRPVSRMVKDRDDPDRGLAKRRVRICGSAEWTPQTIPAFHLGMLKTPFLVGSLVLIFSLITPNQSMAATSVGHGVLMRGNGKMKRVSAKGEVIWVMPRGGIHDLHALPNGHIMAQRGAAGDGEIDPVAKQEVWSYDRSNMNGNEGKKVEVQAMQPLQDGNVMIVERRPARIIEVTRKGGIVKEIKLQTNKPSTNRDTR